MSFKGNKVSEMGMKSFLVKVAKYLAMLNLPHPRTKEIVKIKWTT